MKLGTILRGRYHVESMLGKGGMGAVYLAHAVTHDSNPPGGRAVAVKEMLAGGLDDDSERAIAQFHREAALLASLRHPHLVEVLDFFEEDGRHYLVMSYVEGRTLDAVVRDDGLPPWPTVLGWVDEICDVLSFLHAQTPPVLFRDLKPNNVMLDRDGHIKLIDFGIARTFGGDKTTTYIQGAGTAGYSPVEQFTGGTDARSDVYALGATTYCLLTGVVPPLSIAMMNGEASLRPVHELNPALPPSLHAALRRIMALKRDERCPSIDEARRLLQAAASATDAGSLPPATRCPRCNAELSEHALVCPACGDRFGYSAQPATAKGDPTLARLGRALAADDWRSGPLPATQPAAPPSEASPRAWKLGLIGLLLITVGVGGVRMLGSAATAPDFSAQYKRYVEGLNSRASAPIVALMAPTFKAALNPQHSVGRDVFVRDQISQLAPLTDPRVTVTVDGVEAQGDEATVHIQRQLQARFTDPSGTHDIRQNVREDDVWTKTAAGWTWTAATIRADRQTMDGQPTQVFNSF